MPEKPVVKYIVSGDDVIIGVRTLQAKGRVQVPKEILDAQDLKENDRVFWIQSPDGKFSLVKSFKV